MTHCMTVTAYTNTELAILQTHVSKNGIIEDHIPETVHPSLPSTLNNESMALVRASDNDLDWTKYTRT